MEKVIKVLIIMLIILLLVPVISIYNFGQVQALNGKEIVIVLDPGHGGMWSGATNKTLGIRENVITLKVVRGVRDYLAPYYGIRVIQSHDGMGPDQELEIVDIGMIARNNNADMLISFHFNDSVDLKANGGEVYVTANKSLPKYNEESTKFGNIVLRNLGYLGIANRGVRLRFSEIGLVYSDGSLADYYGVIRYAMNGDAEGPGVDIAAGEGIPGILIEHCFMNGDDSRFIDTDVKLQAIAKADADAIIEYFGLQLAVNLKSDKKEANILNGTTTKVNATMTPIIAGRTLTWNSSDTSVATVDNSGIITGIGVGTCKITATTTASRNNISITVNVNELEQDQVIEINNLKKEHTLFSQIQPETSVNTFMNNINVSEGFEIVIKDVNGKVITGEENIGTGTIIEIQEKETGKVIQQYECIVYGDLTGEGKVNSMSMFLIRQHLLGTNSLDGLFLQAANVSRDSQGTINSMTMFTLRQHLLGNDRIEQ